MRTSISHPLQIAEIVVGAGCGRVGLTFCPGKVQSNALSGSWNRNLGIDLDVIAGWGAAAVITLIEPHEMEALKVADLGRAVADRQISWFHLPIADVNTPDQKFERAWAVEGEKIRSIIRSGSDVLVHCKGGLGRAGMIAARLLVELGWQPEIAIEAVRRVRPGAIETRQQEHHVLNQSPVPEPEGEKGLKDGPSPDDYA